VRAYARIASAVRPNMPGMAFKSVWSEELKRAVVVAQLDHGLTAREASDAAHRGELPGIGRGVAPAPIGVAYCRDLASDERRKRKLEEEARKAPGEIVGAALGRLAAMLDQETQKAERKARQGKVDPAQIQALARAGLEVAKLARAAQEPARKSAGAAPQKPDGDDFIGGLAGS
jgi:hypothetical protein